MAKNKQTRFKDGSKIFLTSDTHFNHDNIVRFCHRPFADVAEMNEHLIKKWNDTVPADGLVFHLGDFAWGGFQEWKSIREKLNGDIVLIRGNHDFKNGPQTDYDARKLFADVYQQLHVQIEGRTVYLNHFPFLCFGGSYRGIDNVVYQAFGHVHSGPLSMDGKDIERLGVLFPSQYDVGVDNNNFAPISWGLFDEIIKKQIESSKNYDK